MRIVFGGKSATEVEVVYNKFTNVVHMLDLDRGRSVTNSIEDLLGVLCEACELLSEPSYYIWYLYGTDGEISEYDVTGSRFTPVCGRDPLVYLPYLEVIKVRKVTNC